MLPCPYCEGLVSAEARKCRHCGEWLGSNFGNSNIATILSLFFPGVGQIYSGRLAEGLVWMLIVAAVYTLAIVVAAQYVGPIGLVAAVGVHLVCVFNAANQ